MIPPPAPPPPSPAGSVGQSFGFAFRDPAWPGKMIVQALILIIPIVGWIATTGWLMLAFENARSGRNELPPAGFHLERGIGIFGVFLLYGVVLSIPAWILYLIGGTTTTHTQSGFYYTTNTPLGTLGSAWSFVSGLFLDFLAPSLIVITYHSGFTGALDLARVWRLATTNVTNSVIAGLMVFVASLIAGLGFCACCIGIFFTIVYQNAILAAVADWFERAQSAPAAPAAPAPPAA